MELSRDRVNKAAEQYVAVVESYRQLQLYFGKHEVDVRADSKSCEELLKALLQVR